MKLDLFLGLKHPCLDWEHGLRRINYSVVLPNTLYVLSDLIIFKKIGEKAFYYYFQRKTRRFLKCGQNYFQM